MTAETTGKIEFRCDCGARIKAPAAATGRRIRCPKCRALIVLTPPAAPASAARPGAAGAWIKLRCGCGTRLKVPAKLIGRKAKCPKCGVVVPVVEPKPEVTPPAATPAAPAFDDLLDGLADGETIAVQRPRVTAAGADAGAAEALGFASPSGDASRGSVKKCPACEQAYPSPAKVCTSCGIHLDTGRALLTTSEEGLDKAYMYAESWLGIISFIVPWGFCPIASEGFGLRKPWVTRGIALVTTLVSIWFMVVYIFNPEPNQKHAELMLWVGESVDKEQAIQDELRALGLTEAEASEALEEGWLDPSDVMFAEHQPRQLLTHALLHGGPLHLIGNLIFLLVFGSRVNALIGNVLTVLLYPLLAVVAGITHMTAEAGDPMIPMLGASGAIMGLAGMYLVFFPLHKVHMVAWLRWAWWAQLHLKLWAVRGFWVVLFYIAFDIAYTIIGLEDGTAHWAHLGGFFAGVFIALVLLATPLVNARGGDLLTAILGRHAWGLIGKPNRPGYTLP